MTVSLRIGALFADIDVYEVAVSHDSATLASNITPLTRQCCDPKCVLLGLQQLVPSQEAATISSASQLLWASRHMVNVTEWCLITMLLVWSVITRLPGQCPRHLPFREMYRQPLQY